jgi:hypothetical protein
MSRLWDALRRRPIPPPVRATLAAPRVVVTAGEPVRVAWDAPGADAVRLEPGAAGLPPSGWTDLALPRGRHCITLHVTRGGDATTVTLHVTVLPADAVERRPPLPPPGRLRVPTRAPRTPAVLALRLVTPRMQVAPLQAPMGAVPPLPASRLRVPALYTPPLRDS